LDGSRAAKSCATWEFITVVVQAYSAMQMWLNQEENAGAKA